jgi:hypothetical protein
MEPPRNHARVLFRGMRRTSQSLVCLVNGCKRLIPDDREFTVGQHFHMNIAALDYLRALRYRSPWLRDEIGLWRVYVHSMQP